MKAILFEKYGSPDVLQLKDTEKPTPQENQVLIKVHAAAANPLDWHGMRADPFLVRISDGWQKPKDPRLGADVAGTVDAVGKNVTQFKPGDAVFGSAKGCFAEYVCANAELLALKPTNISFEAAAAVPVAAYTALQGLRDKGQIKAGQKVLINGASGGVGTFAVQIAKSYGAEVSAVCSGRNLELVRSIGADYVIDYTKEDFTQNGKQYDLIFDTIGNLSLAGCRRALSAEGICSVAGFTSLGHLFETILFGGKKIGMMAIAEPNKKDLLILKEMLENGKIVSVIDKTYPLSQTPEAIRYLETSRARGKVIVTVA